MKKADISLILFILGLLFLGYLIGASHAVQVKEARFRMGIGWLRRQEYPRCQVKRSGFVYYDGECLERAVDKFEEYYLDNQEEK